MSIINEYSDEDGMPVIHVDKYWYVFDMNERDGYFAAKNTRPNFSEEMSHLVVVPFHDYLTKDQLDVEIARILGTRLDALKIDEPDKDKIRKEEKLTSIATCWEKWNEETKFSIRAFALQVLSFGYNEKLGTGLKVHHTDAQRLKDQDPTVPLPILNAAYDQMCAWKVRRNSHVM